MRLIGTVDTETRASTFSAFLEQQGIANAYELFSDPVTKEAKYRIWVVDEDDLQKGEELFSHFEGNPTDPKYKDVKPKTVEPVSVSRETQEPPRKGIKIQFNLKKRTAAPLTNFFLVICVFLFFWNGIEELELAKGKGVLAAQMTLTPVMQELLFDYPRAFELLQEVIVTYPLENADDLKNLPPEGKALYQEAENTPSWKGIYDLILHKNPSGPLFEKIGQGEVWRLFTPALLHRDFLHILFNMAWLWILGRQIEERLSKWKFFFMILLMGVVSNVAQYLMSGPYFLGFSGVVVGMAGFIWVRQKIAPWEGYPLKRSTAVFIAMFVVAMFALELISFLLQVAGVIEFAPAIANTAHISGGLVGIFLARLPLFARRKE
jgi:GlpG protein